MTGSALAVQLLRLCLPVQGVRIQSLPGQERRSHMPGGHKNPKHRSNVVTNSISAHTPSNSPIWYCGFFLFGQYEVEKCVLLGEHITWGFITKKEEETRYWEVISPILCGFCFASLFI